MLCQNVCVVPLGIIAIVSVDEDEEPAGCLLALLQANIAQPATVPIPAAKTRRICCSMKGLKAPEPPRRAAENGILFTLRALVNGSADDINARTIVCRTGANGPIGSKHQAFRPKCINGRAHVPVQVLDCPSIP